MHFQRSSGILLHPTSLPGPFGSGDLGSSAYYFTDWMVSAGQSVWQMLPLGPVGLANSPYMCLSAFAGSPLLIDLYELKNRNWLTEEELRDAPKFPVNRVDYGAVEPYRMQKLHLAARRFFAAATAEETREFAAFCKANAGWLNDYALFQALNEKNDRRIWTSWDPKIVRRDPAALKTASAGLKSDIEFHRFVQWCFWRQWGYLRKYAAERGVKIMGDIPIFVAHHSSDVWANPGSFHLLKDGNPKFVAGVPPDYFSKTGQRWGNPLYRWDVMKEDKYSWWIDRFRTTFALFDILRIDHFRGFEAYWEIHASEKTAERGRWVKAPGADLFKAVQRKLGNLPIIAEDLGVITPAVEELRDGFEFPGMKILQFAFASDTKNNFLPHRYDTNCVVYTGTHDNDTTRGWFEKATARERDFVTRYLQTDGHEIHWDLLRLASQSVADIAVYPFQDVLGLGSEGRMNFPGTTDGNWEWRFTWEQVGPHHAQRLYETTALSGRCTAERLDLPAYPSGKVTP